MSISTVLVCYLFFSAGFSLECPENIFEACELQNNCDECIRQHPCCNFCYTKVFSEKRCSSEEALKKNNCENIEKNYESETIIDQNNAFMDVIDFSGYSVQLRPQKFKVKLRKGEQKDFSVTYKPAKNHPVDLYYLIDLTISMSNLLDNMKHLGEDMSLLMEGITTFYRFGFGSYDDKAAMPFYKTDLHSKDDPCLGQAKSCVPDKLFQAKLSANLDKPEGGLEALMQLLLCQERLQWHRNSRKFILLATDSPLHSAGDGILVGAVKRNNGTCLINEKGDISHPLIYDYPTFGDLKKKLKEKKTNIIVATKGEGIAYYHRMNGDLFPHEMYVGELEKDSKNVLELIETGYRSLAEKAIMEYRIEPDSKEIHDNLNIQVFVDCKNTGEYAFGNTCENVTEGKIVGAKLQLNVTGQITRDRITIFFGERNIKEEVVIEIQFIGMQCKCPDTESVPEKECRNGIYRCNTCLCDEGWTGEICEEECISNVDTCRETVNGTTSVSCYGNGICNCGTCKCDYPYSGQFCKYRCPVNEDTMQVCSNHGTCIDGTCICYKSYINEDCSYSMDDSNCVIPGTEISCSNHGRCENNRCICDPGYHGKHCEACEDCVSNELCSLYEDCVLDMIEKNTNTSTIGGLTCNALHVRGNDEWLCRTKYKQNETECDVYFNYRLSEEPNLIVYKECAGIRMSTSWVMGIIIASILLIGIILVILYKACIHVKDKREYKRFITEQNKTKFSHEQNPLYNSPVRTYENIDMKKMK